MKIPSRLRSILKKSMIFLVLLGLFIIGCDQWVRLSSRSRIFSSISELPGNDVGLVLGTSKSTVRGTTNLFFKYRMAAAAKLYKTGKIRHFILSGDNHIKAYDEPSDMKKALMVRGVPASAITLDYAGFRTLDSIVRAKEVFGQNKITVVSQTFHNQRAVFIARAKGIEAVGFNAKDVSVRFSPKTYVREYLARVKAVLDLYILGTRPKFLGKKIDIKV